MGERVGVVGIVVTDRKQQASTVNRILSEFGDIVVGRMGIPYREHNIAVIALIVNGNTDQLGALTGKLGSIPGVKVKSALVPFVIEDYGGDSNAPLS